MVESTNRVTKHAYADEVTTLELVMRKEHYIPKYQRNYDWETSHCSELLEDLKKFTDNPRKDINSKYMFGQMVAYNSDSNKLYILDGQQRLTTAALLVAAVRNILRRVEIHNPGCEKLQEEKFKMKNLIIADDKPRLKVAKENEKAFDIILNAPHELDNYLNPTPSEYNMISNYLFFYENFLNMMGIDKDKFGTYSEEDFRKNKDKYPIVLRYYQSFINFKVCAVYTMHLSEAYEMFEAINNRGIRLSNMDLLKNQIYNKCYGDDESLDDDEYKIDTKWKNIVNALHSLNAKGDKTDKYLRYYANATTTFIRSPNIYTILIRSINNKDDAIKFVDIFSKSVTFFKFAFRLDKLDGISDETVRILRGFRDNNFEIFCPMALSVYLKNKDVKKLDSELNAVLKAYDRFYAVCVQANISTSTMEEPTSHIAIDYYNSNTDLKESIAKIYAAIKQDEAYLRSQLITRNWDPKVAKYILSELFNRADYTNSVDYNKINIEHILPKSHKNLEKYWPDIDNETHKRCFSKLGNYLILNGKVNNSIKDKGFEAKVQHYLVKVDGTAKKCYSDINDQLFIVKGTWDEGTIEERTIYLVDKIFEYWPVIEYDDA